MPPRNMLPMSLAQLAQQYEQRGLDLYGQEPDISGMQDYARQRAEEGRGSMLNALAAQYAGQSFQPLQAQFLKKAAASQEPMQVGNAGFLTPQGQFVKDPTYGNDRRAEVLLKQASSLYGLDERQQRAQADRDSRESMAAMRAAAGADSRGRTANLNDSKFAGQLYDDWYRSTDKDRLIQSSFQNLKSAPADPAGDISFIFQYMKMLDPGSVVREGEFATAQNAASVPDQIRNLYNRAMKGTRLNATQRQQFLNTAQALTVEAQKRMDQQNAFIASRARAAGIDPALAIPNFTVGGSAPAAGGPDPLGLRGGN